MKPINEDKLEEQLWKHTMGQQQAAPWAEPCPFSCLALLTSPLGEATGWDSHPSAVAGGSGWGCSGVRSWEHPRQKQNKSGEGRELKN